MHMSNSCHVFQVQLTCPAVSQSCSLTGLPSTTTIADKYKTFQTFHLINQSTSDLNQTVKQ